MDTYPTFKQVFFSDDVVHAAIGSLKVHTSKWALSSLRNEAVLLNEIADAASEIGSNCCSSPIYRSMSMSMRRVVLDRKGPDSTDLFGADLGVTLSLQEDGVLVKQRTALFQLKVGQRNSRNEVEYLLDVRQIYNSGHNEHSFGRWFMAVCEPHRGIWHLAEERQIASDLDSPQLNKVPYSNSADRKVTCKAHSNWYSVSEWIFDWLSEAIGKNSDISNPNRIEAVLDALFKKEQANKAGQKLDFEFDEQFAQFERFLPREHIHYIVETGVRKHTG